MTGGWWINSNSKSTYFGEGRGSEDIMKLYIDKPKNIGLKNSSINKN